MKSYRRALLGLEVAVCSLPTIFLVFPLWYALWLGAAFDQRVPQVLVFPSFLFGPFLGAIAIFRYWTLFDHVRVSKAFTLRWYDFAALICGVAFFATVRLFVQSWFDPVIPDTLVPSPATPALLLAASYLHLLWLANRRLITFLAALSVIAVFGVAAEGCLRQVPEIDGPVPLSWSESVALRSGEVLATERSFTENRKIREQVISFTVDQRNVEWKLTQSPNRVSVYLPLILDVIDGEPVIVYPVDHSEACQYYDYPPEGVVAFRYRNGQWSRTEIGDLPLDLKVNLLTSTHEIRYGRQYKGVAVQTKVNIEDRGAEVKQGMPLAKLIGQYSNKEYACTVYMPTPNPLYEKARDTIEAAERQASAVAIELLESSSQRQKLTERDFSQNSGTHTNGGYVRSTCEGIVENLERYYVKRDSIGGGYNIGNIGYRIVPTHGTTGLSSVPVAGSAVEGSVSVACDTNTIYGIKRPDRRTLVVHRFSHGGELIDASRIDLTAVGGNLLDNPSSSLWNVSPSNDGALLLTFAVTEPPTEPNWYLGQRITVRAVLPSTQSSRLAP